MPCWNISLRQRNGMSEQFKQTEVKNRWGVFLGIFEGSYLERTSKTGWGYRRDQRKMMLSPGDWEEVDRTSPSGWNCGGWSSFLGLWGGCNPMSNRLWASMLEVAKGMNDLDLTMHGDIWRCTLGWFDHLNECWLHLLGKNPFQNWLYCVIQWAEEPVVFHKLGQVILPKRIFSLAFLLRSILNFLWEDGNQGQLSDYQQPGE